MKQLLKYHTFRTDFIFILTIKASVLSGVAKIFVQSFIKVLTTFSDLSNCNHERHFVLGISRGRLTTSEVKGNFILFEKYGANLLEETMSQNIVEPPLTVSILGVVSTSLERTEIYFLVKQLKLSQIG